MCLGLGVKGEMMELEPSEPLREAYVEDSEEEEDEESLMDEDMVSTTEFSIMLFFSALSFFVQVSDSE